MVLAQSQSERDFICFGGDVHESRSGFLLASDRRNRIGSAPEELAADLWGVKYSAD